ncbi:hypothetical protein EEAAV_24490 (plasmid) [Rahnella aceris]|jgi:hypothetical protein|uniref:hypothetical protein n=1 Tax=Rahnella TaxID=34037 RepID=UPI000DC39C69
MRTKARTEHIHDNGKGLLVKNREQPHKSKGLYNKKNYLFSHCMSGWSLTWSIQVTAGDFTPANTQMLLQILRRLRQREAAKIIG